MTVATLRPPGWYWLIAFLALLWEAFGCYIYLSIALSSDKGDYAVLSTWQWSVFAIAVWVGLLGAVGLVLRQRWAILALAVSLIAAIIQYGYAAATTGLNPDAVPLVATVIIVGLLLVVFASFAGKRGWLR